MVLIAENGTRPVDRHTSWQSVKNKMNLAISVPSGS